MLKKYSLGHEQTWDMKAILLVCQLKCETRVCEAQLIKFRERYWAHPEDQKSKAASH